MTPWGFDAVTGASCPACAKTHALDSIVDVCPSCAGNLSIDYDLERVGKHFKRAALASMPTDLWRWAPLLPLNASIPGPPVGATPLVDAPRLAAELGLRRLQVKDEGRNPSASLKDRASLVAIARAREQGHKLVVGASTGNAASSTATLCAAAGMRARIFVPASAPRAKLAQLLTFGADLICVDGSYDEAFDLCAQACHKNDWFNRNTGTNPFTREGKKTVSFEIAEQRAFAVPDVVAVAVGDGNIISGVHKGFVEMQALGWIDRLPRLLAVQAEGSAAVVKAWRSDGRIATVSGETLADSISVCRPRDGEAALGAIEQSEGWAVAVPDAAIVEAVVRLARGSGVFAEPAAATTLAGIEAALHRGWIGASDEVVLISTGHGLKDVSAMLAHFALPEAIAPDMTSLEARLAEQKI